MKGLLNSSAFVTCTAAIDEVSATIITTTNTIFITWLLAILTFCHEKSNT